ncbi:extracellular solute-binding protein [Oscillibacter sp.]|uniref:extracellular solute-binding protein n=1 Tax=Oscillibacter sp. TaxID=1945593 RepID=UPI002D808F73|nr:extracellular solute-binding protein [Oscillibacter sp.]
MKGRMGIAVLAAALLAGGLLWGLKAQREPVLTVGVYAGSYWETPNGDCYQILDDAISLFQEKHPGVRVEYVGGIPTGAYSEWLAERILKGAEPDLYFVLPEDFNLLASSGALANLDGLMASDPDFDAADYYEPCLRAGRFGGSQYALPQESVPTIMFVNKTLLESRGIPLPDNRWTWEDFYDICARVTDADSRTFGVYDYTWQNALYSNGASLFSEDGTACYLADEKVQAAVRFAGSLEELNGGYTVTARDFDLGRVAFRPFLFSEYRAYQPYPWRVRKYSGFEWDCVCMPAGPDGGNVSELHTMLLGVSARSKNRELAWELARLLSADEAVQSELYTYSHGISPVSRVAENGEALAALDLPGGFTAEIIREIMSTAATAPRFESGGQAMIMAESAVSESGGQNQQSRMLIAQREINIFLNQ